MTEREIKREAIRWYWRYVKDVIVKNRDQFFFKGLGKIIYHENRRNKACVQQGVTDGKD